MIVLVRVDDRLVHSRVLEAWVPFFDADCIVVASDSVARNRFQKQVIESAADGDLLIKVMEIRNAAEEICSGKLDVFKVIIIVGCLRDAMRLYKSGVKFSSVNIGSIHHKGYTKKVTNSVYINKEDEDIIKRFRKNHTALELRDIPADKPVNFVFIVKRLGRLAAGQS